MLMHHELSYTVANRTANSASYAQRDEKWVAVCPLWASLRAEDP